MVSWNSWQVISGNLGHHFHSIAAKRKDPMEATMRMIGGQATLETQMLAPTEEEVFQLDLHSLVRGVTLVEAVMLVQVPATMEQPGYRHLVSHLFWKYQHTTTIGFVRCR